MSASLRIAILCDSPDEGWPSMDIVGVMLAEELRDHPNIAAQSFAPPIRRRTPHHAINRLWLRFVEYPAHLRGVRDGFDLFHVVDHSYAQLLHHLPNARAVVTCHDIDTFRSVLEPERVPRNAAFRAMTRHILSGLAKAAHVACDSRATLDDLLRFGIHPSSRLSVVPLGAHPSCSPDPNPSHDAEAAALLGPPQMDILHVGNTLGRKRIDLLLRVLAQLPAHVRLVRAGGALPANLRSLARELRVEARLLELPFLSRELLAAVYRRAALVVMPSDAEGFGLPVAESMACGTPVLASDLPVLREVGGEAAFYAPPGDVDGWRSSLANLLNLPDFARQQIRRKCLARASEFTWKHYARNMVAVYNGLL